MRPKPSRAASLMRCSLRGAGRISPESPISPAQMARGVVSRTVEVGREDCGHDTHIETRIADFESPCEIQENVLRIHL